MPPKHSGGAAEPQQTAGRAWPQLAWLAEAYGQLFAGQELAAILMPTVPVPPPRVDDVLRDAHNLDRQRDRFTLLTATTKLATLGSCWVPGRVQAWLDRVPDPAASCSKTWTACSTDSPFVSGRNR
jgi:Asp-tRNA(Asn)/Glu-tRNA(Gln) amidotransferase A subunit family amidase